MMVSDLWLSTLPAPTEISFLRQKISYVEIISVAYPPPPQKKKKKKK